MNTSGLNSPFFGPSEITRAKNGGLQSKGGAELASLHLPLHSTSFPSDLASTVRPGRLPDLTFPASYLRPATTLIYFYLLNAQTGFHQQRNIHHRQIIRPSSLRRKLRIFCDLIGDL